MDTLSVSGLCGGSFVVGHRCRVICMAIRKLLPDASRRGAQFSMCKCANVNTKDSPSDERTHTPHETLDEWNIDAACEARSKPSCGCKGLSGECNYLQSLLINGAHTEWWRRQMWANHSCMVIEWLPCGAYLWPNIISLLATMMKGKREGIFGSAVAAYKFQLANLIIRIAINHSERKNKCLWIVEAKAASHRVIATAYLGSIRSFLFLICFFAWVTIVFIPEYF